MAFLVVDYGSSSCRAATVSSHGHLLSMSRVPVALTITGDRTGQAATVDVDRAWSAVCRAITEQRRVCREPIDAVAVAAVMAYVCSDGAFEPLLPALTYADTRSAGHATELESLIGREHAWRVTGRRCRGDLLAPRLRWLRASYPDLFGRIQHVLGLKDEFVRRLTGVLCTDYAHADYTFCFSPATRRFEADLCELAGVSEQVFAPVRSAEECAGTLVSGVAARLGLEAGTPVVVGSSDGTTAMYGCGVLNGDPVMVCGTTDTLMQRIDRLPAAESPQAGSLALTINTAMQGEGYLAGGATGTSGSALLRAAELTGTDAAGIESLLQKAPPGADGVVALPGFTGERAPYWDSSISAGFVGLAMEHKPEHLLRAVAESAAYRLRRLLTELAQVAPRRPQLVIAGGGAQSSVHNQIRSDILGVPLARPRQIESTIIGSAMYCRVAVDEGTALSELGQDWIDIADHWQPDTAHAGAYAAGFARFERVLGLLGEGHAR